MQRVAAEMNLSETAFLLPEGEGWRLRWFTPAVEVSLCGHATLASAHILWESGALAADETARFDTLSGLLKANQRDGWIELDFPARDFEPAEPPVGLVEALGVQPVGVVLSRGTHKSTYVLELAEGERTLQPCRSHSQGRGGEGGALRLCHRRPLCARPDHAGERCRRAG